MNINEHKYKLIKFWIKRNLKPFIRIDPEIKHIDNQYYYCNELKRFFYDENLSMIKDLSINEILELNLPLEDIKSFLEINHPSFVNKLKSIHNNS